MAKSDEQVEWEFDAEDAPVDFEPIPSGTYLCRIAETRVQTTRSGHVRWALRFVVDDGEFCGKTAAWDGLVFSERAAARVRRVLRALGLPHQGRVRLRPSDLVGRRAFVRVEVGSYTDEASGRTVQRNQVPYDGVQSAAPEQQAPRTDDVPF